MLGNMMHYGTGRRKTSVARVFLKNVERDARVRWRERRDPHDRTRLRTTQNVT